MKYFLLYLLPFLMIERCDSDAQAFNQYEVEFTNKKLLIDGEKDAAWKKANHLSTFHAPWPEGNTQATSFYALHNKETLYFFFEVADEEVHINSTKKEKEMAAVHSDRVELFFATDNTLQNYFCLEMDAAQRVFDCEAQHYRKIKKDWDWPNLELRAKQTSKGYNVEGAIKIETLEALDLINNNKICTGIFRADYYKEKEQLQTNWLTWINPNVAEPDFHTPSAFGYLLLK